MQLLKNIVALVIFFCVAALLLYVGVALLLVALVVGMVAAVWYAIKFYFIRKELVNTMREHQDTRFHQSVRRDSQDEGTIIEGEFTEVDSEEESHQRKS